MIRYGFLLTKIQEVYVSINKNEWAVRCTGFSPVAPSPHQIHALLFSAPEDCTPSALLQAGLLFEFPQWVHNRKARAGGESGRGYLFPTPSLQH